VDLAVARRHRRHRWVLPLVVGLIARIAYWIATRAEIPDSDALQYLEIARNIGSGHGFAMEFPWLSAHPTAFRPPLYPLLIAPTTLGGSLAVWPARLISLLLGLLAIHLAQRYVEAIGGRRAALLAAFGIALYPPLIANDVWVLAESLSLCLLGGILLALNARRPALVGLLAGLLLLTKPGAPLAAAAVVALVAWTAWRAEGQRAVRSALLRPAAVSLAVAVAVCVPWLIRNHQVMGINSISTSTGFTAAAIYAPEAQERGDFVDPAFDPVYEGTRYKLLQTDEGAWSTAMGDLALEGLRSNPGYVFEVVGRNTLSWFEIDPGSNTYAEKLDGRHLGTRRWSLPAVWIVTTLGVVGLGRRALVGRDPTMPLLAVAFMLPSLLTVAPPRLRSPFDYLVLMAAALLVDAWWTRRRESSQTVSATEPASAE
jgi:4-amino-4-deoxy-L-arabinose transferase-like glycosyltransferase